MTWPATGKGRPTGGTSASGTSASPSSRLLLFSASCRCRRTCSNRLLGPSISSSPETTISSGSECILSSPICNAFSSHSRLWYRNSWRFSNCSWQRGHMCASGRSLASSDTWLISSSEHDPELSPMETRRTQEGLTRGMVSAGAAGSERAHGRRQAGHCRARCTLLGHSRAAPLLGSDEVHGAERTRRVTERTTRHLKRD